MISHHALHIEFHIQPHLSSGWNAVAVVVQITWATFSLVIYITVNLLFTVPTVNILIVRLSVVLVKQEMLFVFYVDIFRSTLLSRPNKSWSQISIRAYVRLSTKTFFDFNEIWPMGIGQWLLHDGMQYDLIQGQGHDPFKVGNPAIFKSCLLCLLQWELATEHWFLN